MLLGRGFGLDFGPWITLIFGIHLLNGILLFLLMRRLGIGEWCALAGTAFFMLSASAFEAYWKPMYIFDLLCTTFCLASTLLYAAGRWILSFAVFWLAYKAKEPAVMLPAVLVMYEYWFGRRKFMTLIPFLLASLSFGVQAMLFNPNKDNEYTFRFTAGALATTIPYYAARFLMLPFSGIALFALALMKDRRIWFGLAALCLMISPVLFLPLRLYEAYTYLPLAFGAIAMASAAAHFNPVWAWVALAVWMPFNVKQARLEKRGILSQDDQAFAVVSEVVNWTSHNPKRRILIYDGLPDGFNDWGILAAWEIAHHTPKELPVWRANSPEGQQAMASEIVAFAVWDSNRQRLVMTTRTP